MEKEDYEAITQKKVTAQGNESTFINHVLKLNHAKKICMVTNNEIGNKIRDYFLECEEKAKGTYIPKTLPKALRAYAEEIEAHEKTKLELISVKSDYNRLIHDRTTYTTTEIAKELNLSSATKLNSTLHEKGIIYKSRGVWVLYSKHSEKDLQKIKNKTLDSGKVIYYSEWTNKGREFILNLINE